MSVPFTFPVSADDFAAYQEKLLGSPLTDHMRAALDAWVPVINDSFQGGQSNDIDGLRRGLDHIDPLIEQYSACTILSRFLNVAKRWILYAWKQGNRQRPTPPT